MISRTRGYGCASLRVVALLGSGEGTFFQSSDDFHRSPELPEPFARKVFAGHLGAMDDQPFSPSRACHASITGGPFTPTYAAREGASSGIR